MAAEGPYSFRHFTIFCCRVALSNTGVQRVFSVMSGAGDVHRFLPFSVCLFTCTIVFYEFKWGEGNGVRRTLGFFALIDTGVRWFVMALRQVQYTCGAVPVGVDHGVCDNFRCSCRRLCGVGEWGRHWCYVSWALMVFPRSGLVGSV